MSNNINDIYGGESKFLKASDLTKAITTVEITGGEVATFKQGEPPNEREVPKLVLTLNGSKGLVLNKTNAQSLAEIFKSDNWQSWIGRHINLFVAKVSYNGSMVNSIRVAEADDPAPKPAAQPTPQPAGIADDDDVPF